MAIEKSKPRVLFLDALRCIAILCVILCHASERIYPLSSLTVTEYHPLNELFGHMAFTIGRIGVPLFLLISGYLLLDSRYDKEKCIGFWKKSLLPLFLVTEAWNIIYAIYLLLTGLRQPTLDFLAETVRTILFVGVSGFNHVWYMPMIMGMYLFLPFVANALAAVEDRKLLLVPGGIAFVYLFVVPVLKVIESGITGSVTLSVKGFFDFSGGIYGIYLISGYLLKKKVLKGIKTQWLALLSMLFFGATVGVQFWAYQHETVYAVWYNCATLYLCAVCLFECASRLEKFPAPRWINLLARYSFGIYLTHNMALKLLAGPVSDAIGPRPLETVVLWALTFVCSCILVFLIDRIPKVGKWLLYVK